MTLEEARHQVTSNLFDGIVCPCCDQYAKVYRRKINSGIARALVAMYKYGGTKWVHKPTALSGFGAAARDESTARYWGLFEEDESRPGSGWWRITEKGEQFICGEITIPKYAYCYNAILISLHGAFVTIQDALGSKFDYSELMGS